MYTRNVATYNYSVSNEQIIFTVRFKRVLSHETWKSTNNVTDDFDDNTENSRYRIRSHATSFILLSTRTSVTALTWQSSRVFIDANSFVLFRTRHSARLCTPFVHVRSRETWQFGSHSARRKHVPVRPERPRRRRVRSRGQPPRRPGSYASDAPATFHGVRAGVRWRIREGGGGWTCRP